ncbi:MAG: DUF354 domain-containing protein [Chitinivibrionales bacterium]|nr:DUF354 domain-containing protein [Chitinivibrionales bacterium]
MKPATVFEINHPGQVHLLRNTITELRRKGCKLGVVAKNDVTITHLLNYYRIPHLLIGKKGGSASGKLFKQVCFDLRVFFLVWKHRYQLGVGSSMTNDHVSAMSPMQAIHLSDDDEDIVPLINRYSYPFSAAIVSPDCVRFSKYAKKNIRYPGCHELAYLHPKRFQPDSTILDEIGIGSHEKYFVLRFVSFKAHHDSGHCGIRFNQKLELVKLLEQYGRVFITAEDRIEPELERYRMPVAPEKIHSLMYYATLFLGDSQTMTSEAAILGTPALKCNSFAGKLSVPNELERRYGLCYSYLPDQYDTFYRHVAGIIKNDKIKKEWSEKRKRFLREKIDVTSFFVWFIEEWPHSFAANRYDDDLWIRFR